MARKVNQAMSQNILCYAPSKGFRSYPDFGIGIKRELPRELGYPVNMLAHPSGVAEPEGFRYVVGHWQDGSPIYEADELLSRKAWNAVVRGLRALSTPLPPTKQNVGQAMRSLGSAKAWQRLTIALRKLHAVDNDTKAEPLQKVVSEAARKVRHMVSGILALYRVKPEIMILNVIHLESRLTRNETKAAKHRVKTLVSLRAKSLIKSNPGLDPLKAMAMAEAQFGGMLTECASKGAPSYQYAEPRFDAHNLRYMLQDNTKTRRIVALKGDKAREYLASK